MNWKIGGKIVNFSCFCYLNPQLKIFARFPLFFVKEWNWKETSHVANLSEYFITQKVSLPVQKSNTLKNKLACTRREKKTQTQGNIQLMIACRRQPSAPTSLWNARPCDKMPIEANKSSTLGSNNFQQTKALAAGIMWNNTLRCTNAAILNLSERVQYDHPQQRVLGDTKARVFPLAVSLSNQLKFWWRQSARQNQYRTHFGGERNSISILRLQSRSPTERGGESFNKPLAHAHRHNLITNGATCRKGGIYFLKARVAHKN